ncbi:Fc.00g017330.m01.CDS01 [Cosmosporella sp. VM-42]
MNAGPLKTGPPSRLGQGSYPAAPANNQSLLLDKLSARTSTPDSEALASSDDEADHRTESNQALSQPQRPVRRASWLNETSQTLSRPRKGSFASGSMSPTTSHPSTPSAESGGAAWGSHSTSSIMGRPAGPTFSWGQTGIWNSDRKDPPSRFSEVLPSPTSTLPPGSNSFFGSDPQTSPASREPGPNSQIPFAIPLHPTPKTYRSQSYSVGQMESEATPPAVMSSSAMMGRARHPALQHRPSRPSMLSEMANDGNMLGKVKEVEDDDDESTTESLQGSFHQSAESKIESLTRENAMLRQQHQYNARIRPRAATGAAYVGNGYALRESVPEESDFAVDELDEANESGEALAKRALNRRMSEYGTGPVRTPFGIDNRKNDNANLKKALWSSSLGFSAADISQSRRHSFANMPTRQGSISSIPDSAAQLEASAAEMQQSQDYPPGYPDPAAFGGYNAAAYFGGGGNLGNNFNPGFSNPFPSPYGLPNPYANRAPSPRNVYNIAQPRHNQLLHIVLFKCARADVFYIQEGTGLTVKPGDLVIVEADRGTDLGTVAKDNVDWAAAKELKEHYAEEQYKWLMMYSQGAAAASDGVGAGLLASSTGLQGSAVGGMGPQNQHHMQEPNSGELRPKLIKRLAQSHEVHSLRDKEGQEAKAKRVCMQKVKEHGLNMEILDAEFQMDWKKLTFYYFADSYINFNSLVTDLFKIYKTRIWMSAINPASFASPTLGIQAPSGIGPGAVGVGRASGANDRRQNQQPQEQHPSGGFGPGSRDARGFRPTINQPYGIDRVIPPASGYPPSGYPYTQYGAFGNVRGNAPYMPGASPNMDGFPGGPFQQPGDFHQMRNNRFPTPHSGPSPAPHSQGISPVAPQNDWVGSFQGLSLNSH